MNCPWGACWFKNDIYLLICCWSGSYIYSCFLWIYEADTTPKFAYIIAAFYSCDIYLPKQVFLKFKTFKYGFIILTNNISPFELHSSSSITSWLSVRELLISKGYAGIFEQTLHILTTPWLSPNAKILQGY